MGKTMNILNLDCSYINELKPIIDKFNRFEKAIFFNEDIKNFFANDIPNFHYMFKDRILIRGRSLTSDTRFNEFFYTHPKRYSDRFAYEKMLEQNVFSSYYYLGRALEKKDESLIFKITIQVRQNSENNLINLDEDLIKGLFDDYMSCNYKFYSLACDRVFDVGDGDDTGAVEYHYLKDKDGIDTNQIIFIDIWVRSFID